MVLPLHNPNCSVHGKPENHHLNQSCWTIHRSLKALNGETMFEKDPCVAGQVSRELRIPVMYHVNSFAKVHVFAQYPCQPDLKIPSISRSEPKTPAPKLKKKNMQPEQSSIKVHNLSWAIYISSQLPWTWLFFLRTRSFSFFPACWGCQLPWGDHCGLKCLPRRNQRFWWLWTTLR